MTIVKFFLSTFRFREIFCLLIGTTLAISQYAHPAVLQNAANEALLPPHLLNPFYRTPRVRDALAHSSWFGPGEKVVKTREAEKISRSQIYNVLVHAGLIPRRYLEFY
jgi:hypothetical protein